MPSRPLAWPVVLALAALACGGARSSPTPQPESAPPAEAVKPLMTVAVAGQSIMVTPLTLIVAVDTLGRVPPLNDRAAALAWADSIVGDELDARRPEVKWVLPPEVRKVARRAPTVAPDPDRMGQSLMRDKHFTEVPDPLREDLRTLVALVGGRMALIPASVALVPAPGGQVRAEIAMALADARTGKVLWRTLTWGTGATPSEALTAAMEAVLPI